MAINDLIVTALNATHLFSLDNKTSEESGISSGTPASITGGSYSFVTAPCCEGYTYAHQSLDSTSYTTTSDGAVIGNQSDINSSSGYASSRRTLILWSRFNGIDTPSCIYEQGGGVNNFAFIVGLGRAITFQAADANQPFLIAQSQRQSQVNRNYFMTGIWEHKNITGDYNRVQLLINGVPQDTVQLTGVDNFPAHTGDIVIGNTTDKLKTYNEDTIPLVQRMKWANMLGMYNDISLTESQCREIFERTVLPEVTIAAATVLDQQAALDLLTGNSYLDKNCAIRIIQATDATDYTLLVDNITFKRVDELRDIHIQFVGSGVLTVENTNGSNLYETSTPSEVEQIAATLPGGGSIVVVDGTRRLLTAQDLSDETIAGNLYIHTGADSTLHFENVTVAGEVYNADPSHTLTIMAKGCSLSAANAGVGPGETNIIETATLTLTGVQDNTEVRLYSSDLSTEIFGVENSTGDVVIDYEGSHLNAVLVIHHIDYFNQRIILNLMASDNTLPIQQQPDPTYRNP